MKPTQTINHRDEDNGNDNVINRDVTVSVKDNDSAGLTLSRTSLDVSEDAGPVSDAFTIVLTGQPANDCDRLDHQFRYR